MVWTWITELEDTHSMHISQINDLRISELEEYRNSLQKQLEDTELTEKLRLKQEYLAQQKKAFRITVLNRDLTAGMRRQWMNQKPA